MQNSPSGSGEAPKGFGAVNKPFSFTNITPTSTTMNQNQPVFQNPFKKTNVTPSTLFGMNINPSQAPSVFGVLPKTSRPSPARAVSNLASAFPIKKETLFTKEAFKFSTPIIQPANPINPDQNVSKEEKTSSSVEDSRNIIPDTAVEEKPETSSPKATPLKKSVSTDVSQLRSIAVFEIPEDSNNKLELTKHFQHFGNITRIVPLPRKKSATVFFDSHVSPLPLSRNFHPQ